MDRKRFLKNTCGIGMGSCMGFALLAGRDLYAAAPDNDAAGSTPLVPVDARQIQNVLSYVEDNMEETVRKSVFERLGYEHTTDTGFIGWINGFKGKLQRFFDLVNSGEDTYWEKMEYDPERSLIRITGKPVDKCACPYAQAEHAPVSLCHYCCRNFQVSMFEILLERPVEVRIDEGFLLGDTRCSTTIVFEGKLDVV